MSVRVVACLALLLLAACGSPIVGAECREGLTLCDGRCVDLTSDHENCGSCGEDCGAFECSARMCGPDLRPDADGGADGGVRGDGGPREDGGTSSIDGGKRPPTVGRGGVGNPFIPDGGFEFPDDAVAGGCSIGETACGAACVDLQSDHGHCGACDQACDADQFCAAGVCVDLCEEPLQACGGACVDFENDERNCGGCGIVCRSGLCENGECAAVVPGHLVVIGHDYVRLPNSTMQQLAGNALFLNAAQVRAVVYRGEADQASVFGVNDAINSVANQLMMSWTQIAADADQLSAQLIEANVLLIYAQAGATDAELIELGQRWGLAMTQFLLRGGVIVLFDTVSASNTGSHQLLEPAGLFVADGREPLPARQKLYVAAPGDSVAKSGLAEYRSQTNTVYFVDVQSVGTTVVEDEIGRPVIVHRVVVP